MPRQGVSAKIDGAGPLRFFWDTVLPLSAANAVETRYPRICVDATHGAIALFEQNFTAGCPFTVYSRLEAKGFVASHVGEPTTQRGVPECAIGANPGRRRSLLRWVFDLLPLVPDTGCYQTTSGSGTRGNGLTLPFSMTPS